MTTAQEILTLIETVDPNDTAKLDEIDARVSAYLGNRQFIDQFNTFEDNRYYHYVGFDGFRAVGVDMQYYTRSRDLLKSIRPNGWELGAIEQIHKGEYYADFFRAILPLGLVGGLKDNKPLPTEELAELHAIIQAIEWERNA